MKKSILILIILGSAKFLIAQKIEKVKIEDLASYIKKADHPIVVSFWATWCAPCNHELPYFQSGVKKYSDKKMELVLVSLDFPDAYPRKISDFVKKNKYEARFYWLDETNADHFCPQIDEKWSGAIPSSLFINPGTGYRSFFERQLTEPQLELELKAMMKGKSQ